MIIFERQSPGTNCAPIAGEDQLRLLQQLPFNIWLILFPQQHQTDVNPVWDAYRI